jgi:tetratricopeptide (TPR) repeat protein
MTQLKNQISFIIALFSLFILSCTGSRQTVKISPNLALIEKAETEYMFYFIEAGKLKAIGYTDEAIASLKKCLEIKPESPAVHYELANLYAFAGDYFQAVDFCRIAANGDPGNLWYQLLFTRLLIQTGKIKEAENVIRKADNRFPGRLEIKRVLAELYESSRTDYTKAIAVYNDIEKITGLTDEIAFARERIWLRNGNNSKALIEIQKLTETFPFEPHYWGIYAESLINAGKFDEAGAVYQRLFELDPDNGLGHLSYGEFMINKKDMTEAMKHLRIGMSASDLDITAKIEMIYKLRQNYGDVTDGNQLIDLVGLVREKHPDSPHVHAILSDLYIDVEEYFNARKELLIVLESQKDNFNLWHQLLILDNELDDIENLYLDSKRALEHFPGYARFYLLNGYACQRLKKYSEGIQMLEAGIDFVTDEDNLKAEFMANIAEIYYRENNFSKSDEYFDKSIGLYPGNLVVLNNYSYYLALRGEKLDLATRYAKQAVAADPSNSTFLDTYAWVLFKSGNIQEAKRIIEQALKFGGDKNGVIVEHYGDILFEAGNYPEAKEAWLKARELGNYSTELSRKLNKPEVNKP